MSVSGISGSSNWFSQLSQIGKLSGSGATAGSRPTPPPDGKGGGKNGGLIDTVLQTLSSLGLSPSPTASSSSSSAAAAASASSDSTSPTSSTSASDPGQALASFMQSLMGALQAQGSSGSLATKDSDGDDDGSTQTLSGGHRRHSGAASGSGDLQSKVQSLASSLSNGSDATSSTSASSSLDSSFQNLLNALGQSNNTTSASDFLQAFASKLQSSSPLGNMINTTA